MKPLISPLKFGATSLMLGVMLNAYGATTDLANAPLITSPTASVLPNVFLMLDDSGSMGWDYMPDNASDFGAGTYGAASSQCNGVYYDPNITYAPPVTSTGAAYSNSSFTNAWDDGYDTAAGAVNLSTSFVDTGGDPAQAAFYYKYSGFQDTEAEKNYYNTNSAFYKECNSTVGSTTKHDGVHAVNTLFTKVTVSSTSGPGNTDERTNFANWYSYYRTRMLTMKTATGRAFNSIGTTFRVGYASLNNNTGSDMLQLGTFDATQKSNWYSKLYAATPGNMTPLRSALSKVGRMYAGKLTSFNGVSIDDPIQYSCQQNFTILTTDGFWNSGAGVKVDGTSAIGNQDYFEPRPMYDGSNYVQTITTPYTTVQQRETVTTGATTTITWSGATYAIGAACSIAAVPPSGAVSAYLSDNGNNIGLALSATSPNASLCYQLGGTGAGTAWACRDNGSGTPPSPANQASVVDSTGVAWYLVSRGSALGTGCINDEVLFNDTAYRKSRGVCTGTAAVNGSYVNRTPLSIAHTLSGYTTTKVDEYTASQQTTQTISNGVAGPVSALSPATPSYTFTQNISTNTTVPTSDVWGALVTGATTTTCVDTAALPTAGTQWDTTPSTTSTAGTSTTTVLSTVGPTAGTPTTTESSSGGTSDTLADVAEYYYITDLRTVALGNCTSVLGTTICSAADPMNNVPSSGLDAASHQHMTTFTLGLGARGRMVFNPAYESATSGDFYSVRQGSTANGTTVCTWQTSGSCNWPTPGSNNIENIDDLWHAAVNGRGTYFSAANPTGLATALSSALAGVSARTGSSAAATTSNAFVTAGDNFLFASTFVSVQWTGELIRKQLDVGTGAVLAATDWSAQAQLDANASRNIYFFNSSSTNKLATFTSANLTAAGLGSYFTLPHISGLSQLCGVGTTCLANWAANTSYNAGNEYRNGTTWYRVNTAYTSGAAFGALDTTNASVVSGVEGVNLIAFIKGDRSREGASTDVLSGKYYRQRNHVLGDIVNSESTYLKRELSPSFADPGYSAFKTSVANRQSMVYVGANDGMLHAFYAASGNMDSTTGNTVASGGVAVAGGQEAWAFIPTAVIPNLYMLADKNYSNSHRYFVDGSPVAADICISNCTNALTAVWKTILVGGLNAGGKGYFALDVTNPANPKALWEFSDTNMGYTFGNPKIVKLKTGQWVALLTSGYNNTSGDGQGYLYVVDAYTGVPVSAINGNGIIGTGVGSIATPSGLGRIDAALATPGVDVTALAVYAGDMLGNLWRFDINGDLGASGNDAQLLATLKDDLGNSQPITTKPLLSRVGTTLVVYVGTGRYLGSTDLSDSSQQSFYAIKDTFPTGTTPGVAVFGNPRTEGTFVEQTQTSTTCPVGSTANICTSGETVVVSSNTAVSLSTNGGWFIDLAHSGERINTDPAIRDGVLTFNANVPNASSCSVGGDSYQYQLDYRNGGALSTSPNGVTGKKLGNELATRPVIATLMNGTNIAVTQLSGGDTNSTTLWGSGGGGGNSTATGPTTRKSWRTLIQQ